MADTLNAARVRVPCSTSNLGSGYDTIGLALNRYLEASFEPGPTGLKIFREGSLARAEYDDADDLVARSFASALRSMSLEVGGTLRLTSDIPIGKGLGSSAAAILAGSDLALAAGGRGRDDAGVFGTAYEHEGHGDNLAPCLYGGLRAVLPGATGPLPIEAGALSRPRLRLRRPQPPPSRPKTQEAHFRSWWVTTLRRVASLAPPRSCVAWPVRTGN